MRLRRAENLQVATRRAADESEQRAVVLANQLAEAQKQAKERDELVHVGFALFFSSLAQNELKKTLLRTGIDMKATFCNSA